MSKDKQETTTAADASSSSSVEVVDNRIFFHCDVTTDSCLTLRKELTKLSEQLRIEQLKQDSFKPRPILLYIQSPGGELLPALGIVDLLESLSTPVYSIITGYAASAATIISVACSVRYISKSSFMMIHQLSSIHWGNYSKLKDAMKLSDMAMKTMIDVYETHSKMSREEIQRALEHDSWYDAKETLQRGLVDEIL